MTTAKPKPCPVCGSDKLEFKVDPVCGMFGQIECEQCHAMGPVVYREENVWQIENAYWRLEAEAWKAWEESNARWRLEEAAWRTWQERNAWW